VLLVEDDPASRKIYGELLRQAGYAVRTAEDRAGAHAAFLDPALSLAILDLMLPPDGTKEGGLEQLSALLAARPEVKIIVASGAGDTASMLAAVKAGAYDFLTKPIDPDVLLVVVARALARVALESQVRALEASLADRRPDSEMIGQSPAFRDATKLAERVAMSDLPVLVTGENGTGKELLARSIHGWSPRRAARFVAVNCGAIPETLLESTFFGHQRGAFTGAVKDQPGLFDEADGGTLFLDEIGDMPPALEVKVLRALELGEVLPVGATRPHQVSVRVVSATNRDLLALVAEGRFREDLYWRIKGAEVRLPPLRARPEDVPLLARHFLNRAAHLSSDGRPKPLSDAAIELMAAHAWPGNLRELRHEMQRATVLAGPRPEIEPEDLSFSGAERAPAPPAGASTLVEKLEALERRELEAALSRFDGNRSRAAQALGISRQGLLKKIERYKLG
jgi:DNA-binding NtrC family response regulator